jgi:hypothetical protein
MNPDWRAARVLSGSLLAPFGTSRFQGLRALWDLALFGTSRSSGLRAVWHSPLAVLTYQLLAVFGFSVGYLIPS